MNAHTDAHAGSVDLICGCMFTGKTEELLRRIRAEPSGTALVIKHMCAQAAYTARYTGHLGTGCDIIGTG